MAEYRGSGQHTREGRISRNGAIVLIVLVGTALMVVPVLFEVSLNPRFALPRTVEVADAAQEARYRRCFESRDADIHREAFTTIDNPDVQREFISMRRDAARNDCRRQFPRRTVTVEQAFCLNLLDLDWRYD